MVQQTTDSKFSEYRLGNTGNDLPTHDKQLPVAVKKTVLRDLQNDNRIMVPNSTGNSPILKDRDPISDATKVSGTKMPSSECPVSPPRHQSPSNNAANGHLVYVRRKSEAELGKSITGDSTSINADCLHSRQLDHQEEATQPKSQMKEPKVSSFTEFAPFPMATSMNSSGKPSVPLPLGKPGTMSAPAVSDFHPVASAVPSVGIFKNLHWEERYLQLQMLLRQLDQSDQADYIQMLRLLSPFELSRHAVELERRSIQLSLEEAKELQRVAAFNVLGKSMKNFKAPSTHQDRSEK